MREIQASTITDVVEKLCIEANYHLPEDVNVPSQAAVPARMARLQKVFWTKS